jgi:RND family efflux transporter MFP subunit
MTRKRIILSLGVVILVTGTLTELLLRSRRPASVSSDDTGPVVSVTVAPIIKASFTETITGWGQVEPEQATAGRPAASGRVASPTAGLLAAVLCGEGQLVERGAVLFRLDTRVADVNVGRARGALDFAEQRLTRQEQLGPGEATSRQAYEQAQQEVEAAHRALALAETERALLVIPAPLSGTVVRLNARRGDAVEPTQVLAEIIDLQRLVVPAAIPTPDALRVKVGAQVQLLTEYPPAGNDSSKSVRPAARSAVTFVGRQVNQDSDTVIIRAAVPPTTRLRPGQFITMRVQVDQRRDRLAVPEESLVRDNDGESLAIVEGSVAIKQRVTAGLRNGVLREVEGEGLREGLMVAVSGAFDLGKRTRVQIVSSNERK